MSRIRDEIKRWEKRPPYEGVRVATEKDLENLTEQQILKIELILEAMDDEEFIYFHYDNTDRLVVPFVIGLSSLGNPLMRGVQWEGTSRSGKGLGWRVYQIRKMEGLKKFWEYFETDWFKFDRSYPWIYKVFKML